MASVVSWVSSAEAPETSPATPACGIVRESGPPPLLPPSPPSAAARIAAAGATSRDDLLDKDQEEVWFKRRRTKWRKCRRALRIRDAPALRLAHPVVSNWGGPGNTTLIQEPKWVWVLLEPMPLEPMPLELTPMPPMPPMLAFLPMPPLPPLFLPLPWILPPSIHSGCPHVALPGPLSPVAFL
ncbi:unnamed protein product [Rangifer tarandus platyrhynchus]|uniref:Uncharacterized protein n=1 Tax=Rangifer tarandus platyrhynchus TaxID=3082113 RepID=A0ABN9A428_RANTA|nr:unnamed protein product [Rangifer tarandus platyrhynchus]